MAKGQKIDELYISLGLDIARLQLDFDTAGRGCLTKAFSCG